MNLWLLIIISPLVGWYIPLNTLTNVDFPAPFSPRRTWTSPNLKFTETLSNAVTPGNLTVTFFSSK